ncbi:MAG: hypothetical protein IJG16_07700, partial [Clostridia bacterium]|nr:hypothetical protein [Clostridia bacterium]
MKMNKKFLAIILAASMAVSAAPMALADEVTDELIDAIVTADDASFEAAAETLIENEEADYEPYSSFELFALKSDGTTFTPAEGYDVVVNDNTFDTETDGYKVSDGSYQAWKNVTFSGNYYASIDFMYTDAAQIMEIRNKTSGGDLGPAFLYNTTDGLANRESGSGTASLYKSFALNKWYKLVINGRMKVTGALTYFSLYERGESGDYTQVVAPTSIYLRNFQPGSTKSNPFLLISNGTCIDNEYAVQQWPSVLEISAPDNAASIDAGKSIQFSATAKINETDTNVTQPTIVWSLTGVSSENTEYITIDAGTGKLTVDARAKAQLDKVTVVAEAQSNGKPRDSYEIEVNVQDLTSEPFDAVTVSGASEVAAGGVAETYTFTAEKDGSAVTPAAGTYKWKILDSTGSRVLGNKFITISD